MHLDIQFHTGLSEARLLLNIVTGGSPVEQRRFGDHLDHDRRYDRCDEFLSVLRGAWSGPPRLLVRLMRRFPALSYGPAYLIGVGPRPERAPAFARRAPEKTPSES